MKNFLLQTEEKSVDTRMEENEEELATAKKTEEPEDPKFDGDGKQNVEATNIEEEVNVPELQTEEKSQGKTGKCLPNIFFMFDLLKFQNQVIQAGWK